MKTRMVANVRAALAVVALFAATPALANDDQSSAAWYAGLGGGYDYSDAMKEVSKFPGSAKLTTGASALVTATIGYRFANRIRLEGELGWERHNIDNAALTGETFNGHLNTWSLLGNAAYDYALGPKWDLSVGGGMGIGHSDLNLTGNFGDFSTGNGFATTWQVFAGIGYWICPDMILNFDWRYRTRYEHHVYNFDGFIPYRLLGTNEQVVGLDVKWHPTSDIFSGIF